jgi:hypothetical protein
MNFSLTRSQFGETGIFGQMISEDQCSVFDTLEHAFAQPDGSYAPLIPAGNYTCIRRLSPKFGYDLFWIQNVPGHDFVEIHIGNTNKDSLGCILLGHGASGVAILNSRTAFQSFMEVQNGVDSFTLTVA